MTCIAAIVEDGKIIMGGDRAGSDGWNIETRTSPKVFQNGEFVMGFTTSFRMGQLLEHSFVPPQFVEGEKLMTYMVKRFITEAQRCLVTGGFCKNEGPWKGGNFLVGVRGHLFHIESDFQVAEIIRPHTAVGSGESVAIGAL